MEEKDGLIRILIFPVIDAAQDKLPVAGEDRPLQRDDVPDAPVESFHQFSPRKAAVAVAEKGLLLLRRKDVLRIEVYVTLGVDGVIGKKILLFDVDAVKPVSPRDPLHAVDLANLVLIGNRQGKNEGGGVTRHQAACRGGLGPRVPRMDERPQQPEGEDGDGDTQERERAAQFVAGDISNEDLEHEHRSRTPCPGV